MKLPANVVAFAGEKVNIYKQFKDYFNHYYKQGTFDEAISLSEKEQKINFAVKEEIARLAQLPTVEGIAPEVLCTHPSYAWATFAVVGAMIDSILPEAMVNSIGLYTDVRVGGYGDSFAFDVKPRDLFVVSKAGRGKRVAEIKKQFNGQVTITPEFRDITVQVSLYKALSGMENMAEFAMRAAKSIEAQMTIDAYALFDSTMGTLVNSGDASLRVAGYTQSVLVEYAQKVSAWNGGNKAIIVGTQLALQNVLPGDTNYRYDLSSDYVKLGYVRTAFGFDVMALPQVADYKTPFKTALSNNKIYIISPSAQKLLALCIEGSTLSIVSGQFDNANLTMNTTMKKAWGLGVCTNAVAATISLA